MPPRHLFGFTSGELAELAVLRQLQEELSAHAVVITERDFEQWDDKARRLLFVALTRARMRLPALPTHGTATPEERDTRPSAFVLHWHTAIFHQEVPMSAVLTVRLSEEEARALDRLAQATGKSRSDLVRDALRTQALRETLRLLQEDLGPQARAAGWLTEEDVLRDVS